MRAPKVYVVAVLITSFTLLQVGYAQTSNAQHVPEATNGQDSSPKPSNPGADTATGPLPDAANNPRPAWQPKPIPAGEQVTPAFPASTDQNSPSTVVSESQPPIPQSVFFELFFRHIANLNKIADHDDKAGEHIWAARWRTHDQREAGLNDSEGQILQETTMDCLRMLKEHDAEFNVAAAKFRAQLKPGEPIQIPPELVQMGETRKKIVSDHIERLKEALGDTSFNKLDSYVRSIFQPQVVVPNPAPLSTTGKK